MRIMSKYGKGMKNRKESLEKLAEAHGYSKNGWYRYQEYHNFLTENEEYLYLFEELEKRPVVYFLKTWLASYVVMPASLYVGWKTKRMQKKDTEKGEV